MFKTCGSAPRSGMSFDRGPGANSHGCTGDCHSSGSFTLRRPDQSRRDSPPIPTHPHPHHRSMLCYVCLLEEVAIAICQDQRCSTLCMIFCGTWNKMNVNDVFCSRLWRKVSSTAPGEVLTWGANDQGQLGNARDWEVGPQTSNFWSMIRVLGCRDAESECEVWKGPRNGFKSDSKMIQTCQNSTQI